MSSTENVNSERTPQVVSGFFSSDFSQTAALMDLRINNLVRDTVQPCVVFLSGTLFSFQVGGGGVLAPHHAFIASKSESTAIGFDTTVSNAAGYT